MSAFLHPSRKAAPKTGPKTGLKTGPVWITRTQPGAKDTARAVADLGFMPLIAPLLCVEASSTPSCAPLEHDVLAFTSANGVRAFAALSDRRHWPVFAVGKATANCAKDLGFQTVICADGDVAALAARIIKAGPLSVLHFSGVHVAGDLVGRLTAAGIKARREIIYATRPEKTLPALIKTALDQGALGVLLHSPKAALTLSALTSGQDKSRLICVSLSPAIDAALGDEGGAGLPAYRGRFIADEANEAALMAALVSAIEPEPR